MCLKVKLRAALSNALSFSLDARRVSVMFFVIALTGVAILFSAVKIITYLPSNVMPFGTLVETTPNYAANLITISLLFLAILLLSAILSLLIKAVFIHNYSIRNYKDGISISIDALGGKIWSIIRLTIIIIILSTVFDLIPFLGWIANILLGLAVFFSYQEIMLGKKGAVDSITGSYSLFRSYWKDVLASVFAAIVSSAIIITLFSIPFIVTLVGTIAEIPAQSLQGALFIAAFLEAAGMNILSFFVSGIIAVIGFSIANLFNNGFITDVYIQLKGGTPRVIAVRPETKRKPAKRRARKKK